MELVSDGLDFELDGDFPSLIGSTIGRYTLVEEIGEGGMGLVYLASQSQPLKRMVALKIIKVGMDTRDVLARFEGERQALSMMAHPNIAKVLDCGATDSGRPYIVMEFVQGLPVVEFCDKHRLNTRSRLQLLIAICNAVQHAHQKGVIHRDLKPSNILVESHDSQFVPKVIDFGIAKSIGHRLTEQTHFTDMHQMLGTPMYMSPEQAAYGSLDVDTRSDVYSLGVILYELLTGKTPFEHETLRILGADELRRMIREVDPPRPSLRVGALKGQAIAEIAQRRSVDVNKLRYRLRGELDWITMKAIEKDRTRRYESPSALAADLQRFLDGESVLAHPPSVAYRFQKTIRKHWTLLLVVACIAGSLFLGLGLSLWQAERARIAEQRANYNAAVAKSEQQRYGDLAWKSGIREAYTTLGLGMYSGVAELLDGLEGSDLEAESHPEWQILRQELARDYRRLLNIDAPIHEVRLVPNSTLIAAAGGDGRVYLVDWLSGKTIRTIDTGVPSLHALAVSRDGRLLATGGVTDPVTDLAAPLIYEILSGQRIHELAGQSTTIESLEFAGDNEWLVCGARYEDVQRIEIRTGVIETLPAVTRNRWLACSPDGTQVASQHDYTQIYIADLHPPILGRPMQGRRIDFTSPVVKSLWLPGTDKLVSLLISHAYASLNIVDPLQNELLIQLQGANSAECFAISDDRMYAVAGMINGEIISWRIPTAFSANKELLVIEEAKRLYLASSPIASLQISGEWILAGTLGGELLAARLLPTNPHAAKSDKILTQVLPSSATWRPDGETLILGAIDGGVYETENLVRMTELSTGPGGLVSEVCISPDRKSIAAIRKEDNKVILIRGDSERKLQAFPLDFQGPIPNLSTVLFSPESRRIAWGGGSILMVASGDDPSASPQSFPMPGFVHCLAWEPDGEGIYFGGHFDTLHYLDLRSGKKKTIGNAGTAAYALTITSDGGQLFSGHDDGSVRIWNLVDGSTKSMFLHHLAVRSIALSHDGRLGASADKDANIAIWFAQTGEQIGVFNLQPKWSWNSYTHRPAMVFTPNDRQLRVLFQAPGNQSILRTWDLKPLSSN